MDPLTNPFAPGAGTPPPELAGRDSILAAAELAIQRNRLCMPARSFMFIGLRGAGKTVLLNEVHRIAQSHQSISDIFEVGTNGPLVKSIMTSLRSALLHLDRAGISGTVKHGLRVLKSFAGTVSVRYGNLEITVPDLESEPGSADSGILSRDLAELFVAVGEAAKERRTSVVLLIDEIQNLQTEEFGALIVAIHKANQKQLPILVVGAGLPSLVKLSAEAKSYAERLFEYPEVGALDDVGCRRALAGPAVKAGEAIDDDVIASVTEISRGYPYFLQEWGYQLWMTAERSPISLADMEAAQKTVTERLDRGFFRSRLDRITEPEKRYLKAMAGLGPGPNFRSGDVAAALGKKSSQLGPVRESLILKGMIFSPSYGFAAFTVPQFDDFMRRADREKSG